MTVQDNTQQASFQDQLKEKDDTIALLMSKFEEAQRQITELTKKVEELTKGFGVDDS